MAHDKARVQQTSAKKFRTWDVRRDDGLLFKLRHLVIHHDACCNNSSFLQTPSWIHGLTFMHTKLAKETMVATHPLKDFHWRLPKTISKPQPMTTSLTQILSSQDNGIMHQKRQHAHSKRTSRSCLCSQQLVWKQDHGKRLQPNQSMQRVCNDNAWR